MSSVHRRRPDAPAAAAEQLHGSASADAPSQRTLTSPLRPMAQPKTADDPIVAALSAGMDQVCAPVNELLEGASASCEPAAVTASISKVGRSLASAPSFSRWVEAHEAWVPWFLTLLAGFTRFYRLDQPPGVVFDESHFGKFTGWYTKREYYFDIHPPMARVVLWAAGRLVGYDPSQCSYENINEQYGPDCKYVFLRVVAASHSTATCVLMYLLARRWGASVWGGILASSLVIFDMLNTIEGRLILLDTQLEFWLMAALFIATCWWQRWNEHYDATGDTLVDGADAAPGTSGGDVSGAVGVADDAGADLPVAARSAFNAGVLPAAAAAKPAAALASADLDFDYLDGSAWAAWLVTPAPAAPRPAAAAAGGLPVSLASARSWFSPFCTTYVAGGAPRTLSPLQRIAWSAVVGVICGNAMSVKMTGLVTPFMVAVESCFAIFLLKRSIPFPDMLVVLGAGILTYAFWFWCHFALMINWTVQTEEFMTENYQATMLGGPKYDPNARWEGFWWTFVTLNIRMVVHNANILAPHHWQSRWHEWVLNQRGVAYYGKSHPHGYSDNIYLIGNHVLHYTVIAAIAVFVVIGGIYLRYRAEPGMSLTRWRGVLAQCAFCLAAYCVNLGPYLSAVERSTFIYHYLPSLMFGELLTARLIEALVGRRHIDTAAKVVFLVLGATWLFFSPWWYAYPLTSDGHARRRWLPRWD